MEWASLLFQPSKARSQVKMLLWMIHHLTQEKNREESEPGPAAAAASLHFGD
jgi:hypothetical protein